MAVSEALQPLADGMFSSAAEVIAALVDRPVTAAPGAARQIDASIQISAESIVTMGLLPSKKITFVARYLASDLSRVVSLVVGSEPGADAMQQSIVSEMIAQITGAMADKLATALSIPADGARAERVEDATVLPAPPFVGFESRIAVGTDFALVLQLDFDGIALGRMGFSQGASVPAAQAAAAAAARSGSTPQQVAFAPMTPTSVRPSAAGESNLDLVHDIPLQISAVLGQTALSLREVVALQAGSVFELDKNSTEPIDLYVNNILIARGEVVVVDDKFAVKISELNPSADKI